MTPDLFTGDTAAPIERLELPAAPFDGTSGFMARIELQQQPNGTWAWAASVVLATGGEIVPLRPDENDTPSPTRGWALFDAIAEIQRQLWRRGARPREAKYVTEWTRTLNRDFIPWPAPGQIQT